MKCQTGVYISLIPKDLQEWKVMGMAKFIVILPARHEGLAIEFSLDSRLEWGKC